MFNGIFQKVIMGNPVTNYVIAGLGMVVGFAAVVLINRIVLKRLTLWAKKTDTMFDDLIVDAMKSKLVPLAFYGVVYAALHLLKLNEMLGKFLNIMGLVLVVFFGMQFLILLVGYFFTAFWINKEDNQSKREAMNTMLTVIKVLIWAVAIVLILDNLGFKISTVVAGMGIGGVAIALAAQAILGDLFSSFIIFFDKPFEIGDFIIVGDFMGVVERIGLKTTRIRSLGGEQLVFSNTDLTSSRVKNYKRMDRRRVVFTVGVVYESSLAQVKEIPGLIKTIIASIPDTAFDRAHFSRFGDFSLNFEVVYYVLSSDYNAYMDIQQQINFKIKEEFEKRKIEFAYPSQTIFLAKS